MVQYRINVGDSIPDFNIKDAEGEELSSHDLFGTPVIIYFYPKDDTPGCTKQACGFRDNMHQLTVHDVSIVGISPDSAASHRKFIQKYSLNFTLLSDPSLEVARKFDVIQPNTITAKEGIERSAFLINREGLIKWIERPVNLEGHFERLLGALKLIK